MDSHVRRLFVVDCDCLFSMLFHDQFFHTLSRRTRLDLKTLRLVEEISTSLEKLRCLNCTVASPQNS